MTHVGGKSRRSIPTSGSWSYTADGFGSLAIETDAKGQTAKMVYDRLGRMRTKTDSTGSAEWIYDSASARGSVRWLGW